MFFPRIYLITIFASYEFSLKIKSLICLMLYYSVKQYSTVWWQTYRCADYGGLPVGGATGRLAQTDSPSSWRPFIRAEAGINLLIPEDERHVWSLAKEHLEINHVHIVVLAYSPLYFNDFRGSFSYRKFNWSIGSFMYSTCSVAGRVLLWKCAANFIY